MEQESHIKKNTLKFFVVVGSELISAQDGSTFSNAIFIRRYARNVLKLSEDQITVYSPTPLSDLPSKIGSPATKFRFLNDFYYGSWKDSEFTLFSDLDFVLNDMCQKIDGNTDAFIFFLDHGDLGSFGKGFKMNQSEIYLQLASMKARSKRIYINSCFSGCIVELTHLCNHTTSKTFRSFKPYIDCIPFLMKIIENYQYNIHEITSIINHVIQYCGTILSIVKEGMLNIQNFSNSTENKKEQKGEENKDLEEVEEVKITPNIEVIVIEEMSQLFRKIGGIFTEIKQKSPPNKKELQKEQRKCIEIEELVDLNPSTDIHSLLSKVQISKSFIQGAINSKVLDANELKKIFHILYKFSISNEDFDFEHTSQFLQVYLQTSKDDLSIDNFFQIIKHTNGMLSEFAFEANEKYHPFTYLWFCELLMLVKQRNLFDMEIKMKNTKMLSSSQSDTQAMTYPECLVHDENDGVISYDRYFQNDPVTCEYLKVALLEPSPYGIDLKRISDQIRLMNLITYTKNYSVMTFQIPLYFQTEDVTNDSLLPLLISNGVRAVADDCITLSGYTKQQIKSTLLSYNLPKFNFSVHKNNGRASPETCGVYSPSKKSLDTYLSITEFNDEYVIVGALKDGWIRPHPNQRVFVRKTPSVEWANLPILDKNLPSQSKSFIPEEKEEKRKKNPPPKKEEDHSDESFERIMKDSSSFGDATPIYTDCSERFFSDSNSSFSDSDDYFDSEEEDYSDEWFDPRFLHVDDPLPTELDDPFDLRYLKVGTNLKCGLRNLDVLDDRANKEWLIIYNTVRLFFYHVKEMLNKTYDNIFTLEPMPENDKPYFYGPALRVFEYGGVLTQQSKYNSIFYRSIMHVFEENPKKIATLQKAHDIAFAEAKSFVNDNYDRVVEPLVNWRFANTAPSVIMSALIERNERKYKERIQRKKHRPRPKSSSN